MSRPPCDYLPCDDCVAAGRRYGERVEWHARQRRTERRWRLLAYAAAPLGAASIPAPGLFGAGLGLAAVVCSATYLIHRRRSVR